jgi:hypothetical protein
MLPEQARENLTATRGYGCLFAMVLSIPMTFVLLLGNIMGDCEPGPGCHDHDGLHILQDLLVALPIAAAFAVGSWLLTALLRALLRSKLPETVMAVFLVVVTLAFAWFSFDPAFNLFFGWMGD